jgi:HlyD family secretion protein
MNATLVAKGATARQKLLELDRTIALLEGERDASRARMAAAREEIARTEAEIGTLDQQRLVEIGERLAEDRRKLDAVASQIRAAADVLERRNLRAPQSGLVVQIHTVTPGAVVGSGVPLMEIVPDGDRLIVETRLPPDAIDTVHVGRPATVRLTAYKRSKAPSIDGEVIRVSPDLIEDERDGETYFEARVALDPTGIAALPEVSLTAGMPVEVAIRTGERRAGDYFLEPLLRHFNRALREE